MSTAASAPALRFALMSVVATVTDAELERIRDAYALRGAQIAQDWASVLKQPSPTVWCCDNVANLTDVDCPMIFVPSLDQPGDLAYHTIQGGKPYGLILADDYQPLKSIEKAAGHEMDETMIDRDVDQYDDDGVSVEVADPIEEDDQPVDIGKGDPVAFSPYVLPAWFNLTSRGIVPMPGSPTTSTGVALAPKHVRPGGYYVNKNGTQVTAPGFKLPAHKSHKHSRRMRRATKLGLLTFRTA